MSDCPTRPGSHQGSSADSFRPEIPAPILLEPDLVEWLRYEDWTIPVPAPFVLRGGRLVAFQGPPDRSFRPADEPWVPSELAHVASPFELGLADPLKEAGRLAVAFADRCGLPGGWEGGEPPRSMPLDAFVEEAQSLRQLLVVWRRLSAGESEAGDRRFLNEELFRGIELPPIVPAVISDGPNARDVGWIANWWGQPDAEPLALPALARLMFMADIQQGLDVRECQECVKLFVWHQSRQRKIGPRTVPPGPRPNFCNATHADTFAKRQRRQAARELDAGRQPKEYVTEPLAPPGAPDKDQEEI